MDPDLVFMLAEEVPKGITVQLHNNGEPLLYHKLHEALVAFSGHYLFLDTNGKLLLEKQEIIRKCLSTITVSVIPDDREGELQLRDVEPFLWLKDRPTVVFRLLGDIDERRCLILKAWTNKYPRCMIVRRALHDPMGSFGYHKKVTRPETGVCGEMMHKLAIDRWGNVYPCVRYDPERLNLLGNLDTMSLEQIWDSTLRQEWIRSHIRMERYKVPLCKACDYWGIPTG